MSQQKMIQKGSKPKKVVQSFSLDPQTDQDIISWLEQLPWGSSSEVIRQSIREFSGFISGQKSLKNDSRKTLVREQLDGKSEAQKAQDFEKESINRSQKDRQIDSTSNEKAINFDSKIDRKSEEFSEQIKSEFDEIESKPSLKKDSTKTQNNQGHGQEIEQTTQSKVINESKAADEQASGLFDYLDDFSSM